MLRVAAILFLPAGHWWAKGMLSMTDKLMLSDARRFSPAYDRLRFAIDRFLAGKLTPMQLQSWCYAHFEQPQPHMNEHRAAVLASDDAQPGSLSSLRFPSQRARTESRALTCCRERQWDPVCHAADHQRVLARDDAQGAPIPRLRRSTSSNRRSVKHHAIEASQHFRNDQDGTRHRADRNIRLGSRRARTPLSRRTCCLYPSPPTI